MLGGILGKLVGTVAVGSWEDSDGDLVSNSATGVVYGAFEGMTEGSEESGPIDGKSEGRKVVGAALEGELLGVPLDINVGTSDGGAVA